MNRDTLVNEFDLCLSGCVIEKESFTVELVNEVVVPNTIVIKTELTLDLKDFKATRKILGEFIDRPFTEKFVGDGSTMGEFLENVVKGCRIRDVIITYHDGHGNDFIVSI